MTGGEARSWRRWFLLLGVGLVLWTFYSFLSLHHSIEDVASAAHRIFIVESLQSGDTEEEKKIILGRIPGSKIEETTIEEASSSYLIPEGWAFRQAYADDDHKVGILSNKPMSYFRQLQAQVDNDDNQTRCQRYGGYYSAKNPQKRRIFYGGLIASEPWELLEIVATETYGLFTGMVFVESNRTQNFTPRPFMRGNHTETLQKLFGADLVTAVQHVNEKQYKHLNRQDNHLAREHEQRDEIIKVWKDQGMKPDDIGLLVDMDETFTRDFFRAAQWCDGIDVFDYEKHHCQHAKAKLVSVTGTFETSPECITAGRIGFHPDMILGHCLEGIGDSNFHPTAPRAQQSFLRLPGWGLDCNWTLEDKITDNRYPLWDMSDLRRTCGGHQLALDTATSPAYARYTAFHFHNFFSDLNATRFKMKTYGHPQPHAMIMPLEKLSNDLRMMYRCARDLPDDEKQKWKRVQGGFSHIKPFLPIYFQDDDYRQRRHAFVKDMVEQDELYIERVKRRAG
jgi:hypothetical protein